MNGSWRGIVRIAQLNKNKQNNAFTIIISFVLCKNEAGRACCYHRKNQIILFSKLQFVDFQDCIVNSHPGFKNSTRTELWAPH